MSHINEDLKKDVDDLLNQIVLKLKDIQGYSPDYDDDGYANDPEEALDENGNPISPHGVYLGCVKNVAERLLKGEGAAIYNESQYYNSNC